MASLTQTSFTQRWLWEWFLILFNSGISSLFFMIYRRFYTKCHFLKILPQWRWWRWTNWLWIFQMGWSCLWQWTGMCLLLLALKIKLLSRANYEIFFIQDASRMKMQKMNLLWTFHMYKVMCMTVGRYLLLLALMIKLLSRINRETLYPEQPQCLKSLLSGLKKCILTLYILLLRHFPVFTKFSNAFILADKNRHLWWQPEPASCLFIHFVIPETISTCLLVFK